MSSSSSSSNSFLQSFDAATRNHFPTDLSNLIEGYACESIPVALNVDPRAPELQGRLVRLLRDASFSFPLRDICTTIQGLGSKTLNPAGVQLMEPVQPTLIR